MRFPSSSFSSLFALAFVLQTSLAFGQLIVAHRGASHDAPENTLAAFQLAWEQGADAIEGDFYLTKDQQVVCIHDDSTRRTATGQTTLTIADSTLQQLRQLDVGIWKGSRFKGERIPTLAEVLAIIPSGKKIFLEIKCGPEIVPALEQPLKEAGLSPDQVTIISFNEKVVQASRKQLPQYRVNWLSSFKQDKLTRKWSPAKDDLLQRLRISGATGLGLNGNSDIVDETFSRRVLDLGYEFHVWTVNDVKLAQTLINWGAYSITTDRPALIREGLNSQGLRPAAQVPFTIQRSIMRSGYDGNRCWVHARPGVIPAQSEAISERVSGFSKTPTVIITAQQLEIKGSDLFHGIHSASTTDMGQSWSNFESQPGFERRSVGAGIEETLSDFSPGWHAATGRLLGVGHSVRYVDGKIVKNRPRHTGYSVFDAKTNLWSPPEYLDMPNEPKFYSCGAGSVQRCDLADGAILLPVYFKSESDSRYCVTVCECEFDGRRLSYKRHGDEMTAPVDRGLSEPSLASFGNRFFLTCRNDETGYVTSGSDGLHFDPIKPWTFDDGEELGNYNTQQHWLTHRRGLFLVYTRKGARNDHVFRHRAPLFIAQVDPERLCILRATETIVIPERGARLGNFGVCQVSEDESWIVAAEWMQSWKHRGTVIPVENPWSADNSIHVAKLRWKKE